MFITIWNDLYNQCKPFVLHAEMREYSFDSKLRHQKPPVKFYAESCFQKSEESYWLIRSAFVQITAKQILPVFFLLQFSQRPVHD